MRIMFLLLIFTLALPAVAAQDGCEEASPCVWAVQIDEEGLSAPGGELEGTVNDWFVFDFDNVDPDEDHTVTWTANDASWTVGYLSTHRTQPFELTQQGTSELQDDPSGDTLPVTITLDDVAEEDNGDEGQGAPAPGALMALVLLGALVCLRRR